MFKLFKKFLRNKMVVTNNDDVIAFGKFYDEHKDDLEALGEYYTFIGKKPSDIINQFRECSEKYSQIRSNVQEDQRKLDNQNKRNKGIFKLIRDRKV